MKKRVKKNKKCKKASKKATNNQIASNVVYETEFLLTSVGQRYKIIVSEVLSISLHYIVQVLVEIDPRLSYTDLFIDEDNSSMYLFNAGYYLDLFSAIASIEQVKYSLTNYPPNLNDQHYYKYYSVRNNVKAVAFPDMYFVPGDHILIRRNFLGMKVYHTAIYLGNGNIVQLSDPTHSVKKYRVVVNLNDWDNFYHGDYDIVICFPILKCRTNQQVIETALSKIGVTKYNVCCKNCIHFTNYCQFGTAFMKRFNLSVLIKVFFQFFLFK